MPRGRPGLIAAALLGAALAGLSLPRAGLWGFGWVGLVPLIVAANAALRRRDAALLGFAAGFGYHAVVLHWIYATCRFVQIPPPVAAFALCALAAALALNWALAAFLAAWLTRGGSRAPRPVVWAVVWTAVAAAAGHWTPRLAVDVLAYTQWCNLALIQAGSWGGPYVVGFAIVLVNAALAEAWLDAPSREAGPAVAPLVLAFALTGGMWIHGQAVLLNRPADRGSATARVEILQPDIDQYHKFDEAYVDEIVKGFDELLSRPGPAPALVVWPETSIPILLPRHSPWPQAARWAKTQRAVHLVGVVAEDDKGYPTNAVQQVGVDGNVDGFYTKREMVPYGEYVPFRGLIPRFVIDHWLQILDKFGDMLPGPARQPLLLTPFGPTSVTICYEAMFPRWARLDAGRGAKLLINVTNDGWYKNTWGPSQHFGANVFRAIENRITVIRSGNTGVSAVIDPWGVVTAELALGERGRLDADVPLADPFPARSFYSRHGDWLGILCLGLTALLLLRRALVRA